MAKKNATAMRFQVSQTHNKQDCEVSVDGSRIAVTRRVDQRVGFIITVLGKSPFGFKSVQSIVNRLNTSFKGASYTYNDVYPTLLRMRDEAGIVKHTSAGAWVLTPKAREVWSKIEKKGV